MNAYIHSVSNHTPQTSYCIVITLAIILYLHLRRENKRRDGLPKDDAERDKLAFRDLTDKENIYFRYVL